MLRYPGALASAGDAAEPHRVCQFLYDLAGAYSAFYTNCPVLTAPDPATRKSRLRLCGLASRLLADGLDTLGLPRVERM
jgi:arginyl-tRNA synthetase